MRNNFSKIALAATLGLALALTIPCSAFAQIDEGKKINTKRWRNTLQSGWIGRGEHAELVRRSARIEALFDKCDREGKTSPAKPGRWRKILAEGWIIGDSHHKEVQENALTELISEGCLDEAY